MQRIKSFASELAVFGIKEARSAIFAGSFFALLFLSNHIPLGGLPRYDFLFIAAIAIQVVLYLAKLETKDEIKTIFLFHVIGLVLELYKTHPSIGSWSYPEDAFLKIGTVPLYSGFMYAAIGSYIAQAWKIFRLELVSPPSYAWSVVLCATIYANFFTNHFLPDARLLLIPAVFIFFGKTDVRFTAKDKERSMPLSLSFILIAFFIWIAENVSTFYGAWQYPDQIHAWSAVSAQKITSWFLMVIISFIIVAYLKHFKAAHKRPEA
ncbi:MAG: DUF817 domain-containing protein [Candidatus Taylorbacteria bacterium]|nr:DUF817 domain-containing protein [Candidatus Taylorbacteria bacterium]